MKKIFGISLVAVFAAMPMMARAADVPNVPMAATGDALTTQSYVKGAYNALAGYINQKQDKLSDEQLSAIENVANVDGRVTTLEGTVGNATSGLVADVAALQSAVNDENSGLATKASQSALDSVADDVAALQSAVNDADSGLVKDVNDLKSAVNDANSGLATKASQSALDSVARDAAANSVAIASNATAIQANASAITDLKSTMGSETMTTDAQTVTSAINELDAAISAIEGANYATKPEVTNTISRSSASTPVSVVSDWGTDSATTVNYSGTLTGAPVNIE